jgi:hypothetical protein
MLSERSRSTSRISGDVAGEARNRELDADAETRDLENRPENLLGIGV